MDRSIDRNDDCLCLCVMCISDFCCKQMTKWRLVGVVTNVEMILVCLQFVSAREREGKKIHISHVEV